MACKGIIPITISIIIWQFFLFVSVSLVFALLIKRPVIRLGPTLIEYDFILSNYICKDPISKWNHIQSFQIKTDFRGDSIQPSTCILFMHSPVDVQVYCFQPLAIINNVAVNTCTYVVVQTIFSFPLSKYLGVRSQGGMINMFYFFTKLSNTFPKWLHHVAFLRSGWVPAFPPLHHTCYCLSSLLLPFEWYEIVIVFLIMYISLMNNNVEHLFKCLSNIHIFSVVKCLFKYLVNF